VNPILFNIGDIMPQVPTYIRQGDWDSYIAIQSQGKWPEFIHNALHKEAYPLLEVTPGKQWTDDKISTPTIPEILVDKPKVIKSSKDIPKVIKSVEVFPDFLSKSHSARKKK
jgi:hypothetical protein